MCFSKGYGMDLGICRNLMVVVILAFCFLAYTIFFPSVYLFQSPFQSEPFLDYSVALLPVVFVVALAFGLDNIS